MPGAMSDYTESKVSDLLLRGASFTSPGEVFLALFTGDPGESGNGAEAAYTGYARVTCGSTPSAAFSALDANGTTQNANTIVFPAVGGTQSVTLTNWALFDSLTGGNMLLYGPLSAGKTFEPTDVVSFPSNSLKITFD